jgi:hypothetical protein
MTIQERIDGLRRDLELAHSRDRFRFSLFYVSGIAVVVLTILASAAAALLGQLGENTKTVGAIAAIPGILTLGGSTLKLNARAGWHARHKEMIAGIKRKLLYELPLEPTAEDLVAVAEAWTKAEDKFYQEFVENILITGSGRRTGKP